jgi:hypothetical protein
MSQETLLFDAAFATATAVLYAYVGGLVRSRPTADADARLANRMFTVFWFGLAAINVMGAIRNVLAVAGVLDIGWHAALGFLSIVPLVALLWGLTYYLAYIYTGKRWLFAPLTAIHALLLGGFCYLVWWMQPQGVTVNEWSVVVDYARNPAGPLVALLLFTILGPVLLLSLGYGTLYFRTDDPTARYRIALVSGAFILWFGSPLVAYAVPALGEWWAWPIATRVIGLISTLMILAAYKPPRFVRDRYAIRSVMEPRDAPYDALGRGRLRPVRGEATLPSPS